MLLLKKCKLLNERVVDILIANGKIIKVDSNLADNLSQILEVDEEFDVDNQYVIPAYIDNHVHIVGGGGEDGFISKVPEISSVDILKNGITTIIGVLGTDTITRNVESLVAKAKALNNDNLTAFCLTGGYEYPSPTITGRVQKDIAFINDVIGVKIAISDHRCYNPTKEDLVKLLSEIRVASLIAKKVGILNIHVGWGKGNMDVLLDILNETNIPINCIRPTHITNNDMVFNQAMQLTNQKGYMDITIDNDFEKGFYYLEKAKVIGDWRYITMSTDSNGSCPIWRDGSVEGMTISSPDIMHKYVRYLICNKNYSLADALQFVTINPARSLNLYNKADIKDNNDADLVVLDEDYYIDTVIAKGEMMVKSKKILKKGYYQ